MINKYAVRIKLIFVVHCVCKNADYFSTGLINVKRLFPLRNVYLSVWGGE